MKTHVSTLARAFCLSATGLVVTVGLAIGQQNQSGSDQQSAGANREKVQEARGEARDKAGQARDQTRDARGTVRDDRAEKRANVVEDRGNARGQVIQDRSSGRSDVIQDRAHARDTARDGREEVRDARRDIRTARREFRAERVRSGDIGLFLRRGQRGPIISSLAQRGAATQSGLKEGDEILSVNGKVVTNEREFVDHLFANANQPAQVQVNREGEPVTVTLNPKAFADEHMANEPNRLSAMGLLLDDTVPDHVRVQAVVPGSPAFHAGLRPGDRITGFGGQRIQAITDFVRSIASTASGPANMEVNRNNQSRQLDIDVPNEATDETRTALRPTFPESGSSSTTNSQGASINSGNSTNSGTSNSSTTTNSGNPADTQPRLNRNP